MIGSPRIDEWTAEIDDWITEIHDRISEIDDWITEIDGRITEIHDCITERPLPLRCTTEPLPPTLADKLLDTSPGRE